MRAHRPTLAALVLAGLLAVPAIAHAEPLTGILGRALQGSGTEAGRASPEPRPAPEPQVTPGQLREAVADISRILDLEIERQGLTDQSYFTRDRRSVDAEVEALLAELGRDLGGSEAVRHWTLMRARQRELADKRAALDRLAAEAELDPAHRDEAKAKIEAMRVAIEELRRGIAAAKADASKALAKAGIDLDERQMDALVATVVGDDLIDLATRVTNLGVVLQRLKDGVAAGSGGPEAQRRYYSAVVVIQRIALRAQHRYLERITGRYAPFVAGVVEKANKGMEEASALRRSETNRDRMKVLDANIKAQRLTIDTATLYRRHLDAQRSNAVAAIREGERAMQVASNTRDTVVLSLDLLANLDAGETLSKAMSMLALPAIQPFNSEEMERAFQTLTTQMGGF